MHVEEHVHIESSEPSYLMSHPNASVASLRHASLTRRPELSKSQFLRFIRTVCTCFQTLLCDKKIAPSVTRVSSLEDVHFPSSNRSHKALERCPPEPSTAQSLFSKDHQSAPN